ncbi:8271_t:CDS:2, partial [Entrophospora sp. SA101]
ISCNGVLNPKIFDNELIMKHLNYQFITNIGVSYNDYMQDYIGKECSDDELMDNDSSPNHTWSRTNASISFKLAIPIVADWTGQFFIHKAVIHWLLNHNEIIPSFITAFLPIMGPLHMSLNDHELIFKGNSSLFNDAYKGIFGICKDL